MGRLYWRFFTFFWLAQVCTSLVMAAAVWMLEASPRAEPNMLLPPPHPPSIMPLLMPMLIGGVISLLFAAAMATYVSRPIRRLDNAFRAVAGGRLEERIGGVLGTRQNELTALGPGFDSMASRLQSLVESQRRLLHDVSHEMRAPLARMQVAVDLIDRAPERRAEISARLHADIDRASSLVNELLTLSRLESGSQTEPLQRVVLEEFLAGIADDTRFEADRKNCTVELDCPRGLSIGIHPELLYRAIDNVMRNAVRHAPEGSAIVLRATSESGWACLAVEDRGSGVAEADRARLFDPFVRGTGVRDEGYGLGLAITRRAIEAHGGSIAAENLAGGGFRVSMRLPAGEGTGPTD